MPDDVAVPKLGKIKKEHALAAVAVAGGFVAAMWWRARSGADDPVVFDANDVQPAGEFTGPPGGGTDTIDVDEGASGPPRTNIEWSQRALEYLSQFGWDPELVSTAIGKYLTRETLTAAEAGAVRTAIGVMGYPPQGGPYEIKLAPASKPAPKPTPPHTDPKKKPPAPKKPAPKRPAPKKKKPAPKPVRKYTVRKGDSLWSISVRYYKTGFKWPTIYRKNRTVIERAARKYRNGRGSSNGRYIYPGTVLIIP